MLRRGSKLKRGARPTGRGGRKGTSLGTIRKGPLRARPMFSPANLARGGGRLAGRCGGACGLFAGAIRSPRKTGRLPPKGGGTRLGGAIRGNIRLGYRGAAAAIPLAFRRGQKGAAGAGTFRREAGLLRSTRKQFGRGFVCLLCSGTEGPACSSGPTNFFRRYGPAPLGARLRNRFPGVVRGALWRRHLAGWWVAQRPECNSGRANDSAQFPGAPVVCAGGRDPPALGIWASRAARWAMGGRSWGRGRGGGRDRILFPRAAAQHVAELWRAGKT